MHELIDIVAQLRAPDGCPWDKRQTLQSLRPFVVEEAHEVVDAIDRGDDQELCKELGDLLFLVTMLSRLAQERGSFCFDDVVDGISAKMRRRHPHVFGTPDQLAEGHKPGNWEAIKAEEREQKGSVLDSVPTSMPAL
ncbi:MAG: MazG family protein, partial [Kiritimatiellia bacterium]